MEQKKAKSELAIIREKAVDLSHGKTVEIEGIEVKAKPVHDNTLPCYYCDLHKDCNKKISQICTLVDLLTERHNYFYRP